MTTPLLTSQKLSRFSLWALPALFLYFALVFLFLSHFSELRFVARDEGFYLYAAKLSARDFALPYLDYFYPQAPLAPFLLGLWMKIRGFSWENGREFSILLTSMLACLLTVFTYRRVGLLGALICAFAFPLSNFVYPWFVLAKAYSLSAFFLLSSLLLFTRSFQGERTLSWILLFSGLLFALAINTRLYIAGLFPLFLMFLFGKDFLQKTFFFSLGLGLGLLPNLALLLADVQTFFFNNLGYHLLRRNDGEIVEAAKRLKILLILFGIQKSQQFHGFLLPFCVWLSCFAFLRGLFVFLGKRIFPLSFVFASFAFALAGISFLPTPVYIQYFCLAFPIFLLASVLFSFECINSWRSSGARVFAGVVLVLLFGVMSTWKFQKDYEQFSENGIGVIGIGNAQNAKTWRLPPVEKMAELLDTYAEADEEVMTSWPGFFVSTQKAKIAAGYENHFGLYIGDDVSVEERARYKIRSWSDLETEIRAKRTRLVLLENRFVQRKLLEALQEAGYTKIAMVEQFSLFSLP